MLRIWDKIYTFQYFPPSINPKDVFGGKPPKPPFAGASPLQSSVYYYWWLFLRENADYVATCENGGDGPCAEIYQDFRDIREDNFPYWWERRGCELFCELDNDRHKPGVCFIEKRELCIPFEHRHDIVIAVSRDAKLNSTMTEIRKILEGKLVPSQDNGESTALYPVFAKPVLHSLHRCYEALRLRREHPKMPLHEFGVLCGAYKQRGVIDTTTQKAAASAAHRLLAQAKLLIEYVGQGAFPVMSRSQVAKAEASIILRRIRSCEAERRRQLAQRDGAWRI